jgi:hypothetical protein
MSGVQWYPLVSVRQVKFSKQYWTELRVFPYDVCHHSPRLHALHPRHFQYIATHDYTPGPLNAMADDASRLLHLSMSELLTHFNSVHPQPVPWTRCYLQSAMCSFVIIALCKQRSDPELFPPAPQKPRISGTCGWSSVTHTASILGSSMTKTQCCTYKCSARDTETAASPPAKNPFELAQWLTPSEWWGKHTNFWGPETSAWTDTQDS